VAPVPYFDIEESQDGSWTRLRLIGELDVGAIPRLEERVRQLSAARRCVRVDLSKLDFIDSSGIRLLVHSLRDSRRDGWGFEVDRELPQQIRRVFNLAKVEHLIVGEQRDGR
jgi:anti-anti-sigma factor